MTARPFDGVLIPAEDIPALRDELVEMLHRHGGVGTELARLAFALDRAVADDGQPQATGAAIAGDDGDAASMMSVHEYAARTGLSERTVRRHAAEGRIPGAEQIGTQWTIPAHSTS